MIKVDALFICYAACKPEHSHCPTYSVDTKFYCRHEWVRDNCRQMCGLGCFDPDNESSSYFRAGKLGGGTFFAFIVQTFEILNP